MEFLLLLLPFVLVIAPGVLIYIFGFNSMMATPHNPPLTHADTTKKVLGTKCPKK